MIEEINNMKNWLKVKKKTIHIWTKYVNLTRGLWAKLLTWTTIIEVSNYMVNYLLKQMVHRLNKLKLGSFEESYVIWLLVLRRFWIFRPLYLSFSTYLIISIIISPFHYLNKLKSCSCFVKLAQLSSGEENENVKC